MFHLMQAVLGIFAALAVYVLVRLRTGRVHKKWVAWTGIGGAASGIVSTVLVLIFFRPQKTPFLLIFPISWIVAAAISLLIFCCWQDGWSKGSAFPLSLGGVLLSYASFTLTAFYIIDKDDFFLGSCATLFAEGVICVLIALGRLLLILARRKRHATLMQ